MKTLYILKHIHLDTEIVAAFSDLKKAGQAFRLYAEYIRNRYPIVDVEQAQSIEIHREWYCNFRNGHIVKLDETKLFTDFEQFKNMILD